MSYGIIHIAIWQSIIFTPIGMLDFAGLQNKVDFHSAKKEGRNHGNEKND